MSPSLCRPPLGSFYYCLLFILYRLITMMFRNCWFDFSWILYCMSNGQTIQCCILFVSAWSLCLTIHSEVRDHIHSSVYTKLPSSVVMWCFHTNRQFTLNWNFASQTFQRVSHQINNPYMENLVENQKNWCVIILLKPSNPLDKMASYFCPHPPLFSIEVTCRFQN